MKKVILLGFIVFGNLLAQSDIEHLSGQIKKSSGNDKVDILNELIMAYKNSKPEEGLKYGDYALSLAKSLDYVKGEARVLKGIGENYLELRIYDKALEYYLSSIAKLEELDDPKELADIYHKIGNIYFYLGKYEKALENYLASLKRKEYVGDLNLIASAQSKIGKVYRNLDNQQKSLEYFLLALGEYEEIGEKEKIAKSAYEVGIGYHLNNNPEQALEYFLKSLILNENLENQEGIAQNLEYLGVTYAQLEIYPEALKNLNESMTLRKQLKDTTGIADIMIHFGDIYEKLNRNTEALQNFKSALKIREDYKDSLQIANTLNKIGQVLSKINDIDLAIQTVEKAIEIATTINERRSIQTSYLILSDIYSHQGNFRSSLDYYKLYSNMIDTLYNLNLSKQIMEMQTRYDIQQTEQEIQALRSDEQKMMLMFIIVVMLLVYILAVVNFVLYRHKKKSSQFLRTVIDSLTHPFYVIDADNYKIDLANSAAISQEDLKKDLKCHELIYQKKSPCYQHGFDCPIQEVRKSKEPYVTVHEHKDEDDNQIFYEVHGFPILNKKGKLTKFIEYKVDITKRKHNEAELVEAKEAAEKADKLKSEFLAQMSHEIRTPINAIINFSNLIREELGHDEDEFLRSNFRIINQASQRIIRTVDLILNMSEIHAGTYEYIPSGFDLYAQLCATVNDTFRSQAEEKGITINIESTADNSFITADEYTIYQVFSNLLDNAIKYTFKGTIDITVGRNEQEKLFVAISDTGIGISDKYLPNLFEPFSQEDQGYSRQFDGNGLGLALVHKYCELNNAQIHVESVKGEGSIFKVVFNQEMHVQAKSA